MISPHEILILEVNKKTLFIKMKDLFPECEFFIEDLPQLYPFWCLRNDHCPRNHNCMEKLVKRVSYVFEEFVEADLLLLYFRYKDRPKSHRAGVFFRDLSEPRYITFNVSAWEKMKDIGVVFKWTLPNSLFLGTMETQNQALLLKTS